MGLTMYRIVKVATGILKIIETTPFRKHSPDANVGAGAASDSVGFGLL